MTLNSWSSQLHFLSAGITTVYHIAGLLFNIYLKASLGTTDSLSFPLSKNTLSPPFLSWDRPNAAEDDLELVNFWSFCLCLWSAEVTGMQPDSYSPTASCPRLFKDNFCWIKDSALIASFSFSPPFLAGKVFDNPMTVFWKPLLLVLSR